jgi:hypothetical protein
MRLYVHIARQICIMLPHILLDMEKMFPLRMKFRSTILLLL